MKKNNNSSILLLLFEEITIAQNIFEIWNIIFMQQLYQSIR